MLSKKLRTGFDLIDYKDFLRITDLTRDELPIAWKSIFKRVENGKQFHVTKVNIW